MKHNLIPPFILHEQGRFVDHRLKINLSIGSASLKDQTFGDEKTGLLVEFNESGIFSIFD